MSANRRTQIERGRRRVLGLLVLALATGPFGPVVLTARPPRIAAAAQEEAGRPLRSWRRWRRRRLQRTRAPRRITWTSVATTLPARGELVLVRRRVRAPTFPFSTSLSALENTGGPRAHTHRSC